MLLRNLNIFQVVVFNKSNHRIGFGVFEAEAGWRALDPDAEAWHSCSQLASWLTPNPLSRCLIATLLLVLGFTPQSSSIHANMCPVLICIPALSRWHLMGIQQLSCYGAKINTIPSFGHALLHERGLSPQPGPPPYPPPQHAASPRIGTRILTSTNPMKLGQQNRN